MIAIQLGYQTVTGIYRNNKYKKEKKILYGKKMFKDNTIVILSNFYILNTIVRT